MTGSSLQTPHRRAVLAGALGAAAVSGRATASASELDRLDATACAELVRARKVSPLELVDAAIARIERLEPRVNALITDCFEQARARARQGQATGPFAGVPYLLKDLLEYAGVRHTSGSRMFAGHVGAWNSPYVQATEGSGLIVLGKSATPEFGLLATTEPLLNGPTRNPWNLGYSAGGSSGGAAVAVASGMVPVAHASDGGGSIRIPASACGVFGLKPSRGRQRAAKQADFPADLSVEHCVSRSVRDSARLLSLTERTDPGAPLSPVGLIDRPGRRRLRIAFTTRNYYGRDAEVDVKAAILETAALCRSLGHEVFEGAWPFDGEEFIRHFMSLWSAAAAGVVDLYRKLNGREPDETVLEPWTLAVAAEFGRKPADAVPAALAYMEEVSRRYAAAFDAYDVFLSPVLRKASVPIGEQGPLRPYEALRAELLDWGSYTPMQNLAGLPAMSAPLGLSPERLPIGSQFTGAPGAEAVLLSLAYELEAARPWAARRPPTA